MIGRGRRMRASLLCVVAGCLLWSAGCGYLRNVRDDFMDVGTVSIGFTPPVVPTGDGDKAVGPLPPAIGAYVEATDFLHLGALVKQSADLEWDRRGLGVVADTRAKFGFGPWHYVRINQRPIWTNDYKSEENELDAWREHMRGMKDPLFDSAGKELIFKGEYEALPYMYKGWQDWETVSAEVAIPEPFITHSGFYFRAGVDVSQAFDAVLSLICIDLYSDAAYKFDGSLRFGEEAVEEEEPGALDRFFRGE